MHTLQRAVSESGSKVMFQARVEAYSLQRASHKLPREDLEVLEFNEIGKLSSRELIHDRGQARAPRHTTNSRVGEIRGRKAYHQLMAKWLLPHDKLKYTTLKCAFVHQITYIL